MESKNEYKRLAECFKSGSSSQKGWSFKQLKREGDVALYEKESDGWKVYEVIRIRISKGGKMVVNGIEVVFEPKELYPKDEDFGGYGFSYGRLEDAEKKFALLTNV